MRRRNMRVTRPSNCLRTDQEYPKESRYSTSELAAISELAKTARVA